MALRHLLLATVIAIVAASAQAGVSEKQLSLPGGLGGASLYAPEKVSGKTAGIIVVHEWWGLNDYARSRARQLAELGYVAIAVDMYGHGRVAAHPKDAQGFMQVAMAEPEKMNARFDGARAILASHPDVDKKRLFAIGYCFGGGVVLNQARSGVDLAGVASFHGSLATDHPAQPGAVKARILVATGGADPYAPPAQVGALVEEMTAAGADLQLLSFPGAKHSFTNPGATAVGLANDMPLAYDKHADQVSWRALLDMIETGAH